MRIITWNMQGAKSAVGSKSTADKSTNISDALSVMSRNGAKTLLLQEAGGYPDGWGLKPVVLDGKHELATGTISTGSRQPDLFVAWYDSTQNSKASHDRCSMAVISSDFSGRYGVISVSGTELRPLLGLQMADGKWLYSIHAPSGNQKAAAGVAKKMLEVAIGLKESFVCAGDFNCEPDHMTDGTFAVCSTSKPTHDKGGTLDYAACSLDLKAGLKLVTGGTVLISDHYSQTFDF